MIFLQIVDGVWTCGVFYNSPFRIVGIDADVVDKHIILVVTLVAEGDITHLAFVCTQVNGYLCPFATGVTRRGQQLERLRIVIGGRDVNTIVLGIICVADTHPVFQLTA